MIHGRVEIKRKRIARLDCQRLGAIAREPADIAPQVLGRQVGDGPVLQPRWVAVLAHILPQRVLGAADADLLEDVVPADAVDDERCDGEEGGDLHSSFPTLEMVVLRYKVGNPVD